MLHSKAREVVAAALSAIRNAVPTRSEVQMLQSMGLLETGYGEFLGGFNWGAVIATGSWKGATFDSQDSRPGTDGKDIYYTVKFRAYHTPEEGCADMIKIALSYPGVSEAMAAGKVHAFSAALFQPKPGREVGYYSGLARYTPTQRIWRHAWCIYRGIVTAARITKESLPNGMRPPVTVRRGTIGPDVLALRSALDVMGPDICDRKLEAAVERYQSSRGLAIDGVVGPSTWGAICVDAEIGMLTL